MSEVVDRYCSPESKMDIVACYRQNLPPDTISILNIPHRPDRSSAHTARA